MRMLPCFYLAIVLLFASNAFAFHTMDCANKDHSVTANYMADAGFVFIIHASLQYKGIESNFNEKDAADLQNAGGSFEKNNIAVIPFKTGENLVFAKNESTVFVFDREGKYLANLDCWLRGFPPD